MSVESTESVETSEESDEENNEESEDERGFKTRNSEDDEESECDDGEDDDDEEEQEQQDVQVNPPSWHEPYLPHAEYRPPVLTRIVTNDRVADSAELPTVAVTNIRSLGPKIRNFSEDILLRDITACLVSETWEKENSKKYKKNLETMFEEKGLTYISCPRPSTKRGGGAAIVVNTCKFKFDNLNILVPGNLECIWGILRPRQVTSRTIYKEIILCAFYSPPNSRKNGDLISHLTSTMHHLLTSYPRCGWVMGGDKNKLPLAPIMTALPRCRQLVTKCTYKGIKIHDVILTNLGQFMSVPYIAPPVQPDDPTTGVPSDHDTAVAEPLAGAGCQVTREYKLRTWQPFPDSGMREFGSWLQSVKWKGELTWDLSPTEQAIKMENILNQRVEFQFPKKSCRVSNDDKPFINAEIKKLDKYVKKEYKQKGKSAKYKLLKSAYDEKYLKAAAAYLKSNVREMMEEAPGKAYRAMKKMGARPGDCDDDGSFTLSQHIDDNLTPCQSVERLADYFSAISQEYQPLDIQKLPERVRQKLLAEVNTCDIPVIQEYQVWSKMKAGKKTKSTVPGELPAKLRHEFGPELAAPATILFNNIAQKGQWVQHWKHGSALPLKKINNPKDESDTRLIEITFYLSLQMEKFVIEWLHKFISEKLDRDQFGGAKGHSVAHYLTEIMNFVLYNQDLSEPLATILTAVDIHKGFNKIDHLITVTKLSDMEIPGWLLKIVCSYLADRTLSIRYRNETSSTRKMPGGTGAGTILGLEIFLILFNDAGPAANPTSIGHQITQPLSKRKPIDKSKVKWIDDITICTAVDLKSTLVPEDREVPRPVPYHGRTGHRLLPGDNVLQHEIERLQEFTDLNKMAINKKKTKIMILNSRRKWDVMPEISLRDGDKIEVVEELKIVGFILRSDMKTNSNTDYIVKKAYARLWLVRRLKALGASKTDLLDVLQKQVLSTLYLGAPAWSCQVTEAEKTDLNRVLKCGLHIIFGQNYLNFKNALSMANIPSVTEKLEKMTIKFAIKSAKNEKFQHWFKPKPANSLVTRSLKLKYEPVPARTTRFADSPIPQMTALLNADDLIKQQKEQQKEQERSRRRGV